MLCNNILYTVLLMFTADSNFFFINNLQWFHFKVKLKIKNKSFSFNFDVYLLKRQKNFYFIVLLSYFLRLCVHTYLSLSPSQTKKKSFELWKCTKNKTIRVLAVEYNVERREQHHAECRMLLFYEWCKTLIQIYCVSIFVVLFRHFIIFYIDFYLIWRSWLNEKRFSLAR